MAYKITPVLSLGKLKRKFFKHGEHFESLDTGVSERLGLTQIGAGYCEVPPGKPACPFHVHHVEDEIFFFLEWSGVYGFGESKYPFVAGDILGAPRGGPEFAHKITNTGDIPLKYLAISTKADTEVCEYPDSGKILVSREPLIKYRRALW